MIEGLGFVDASICSRMRSRRVPVLKLGSRGPGGDARSLRKRSQASQSFASVRNRSRCVGLVSDLRRTCRREKIVGKRRTVVTFYVLHYKSVNNHGDPGGSWSRNAELSSLLDSFPVFTSQKCHNHRDRGGRGRETQNCRHFWTPLGSSRLKSVSRGRETQNCRHFWTRLASSRLKSVNNHRDRGGRGRETQNCRHLWTRVGSLRLKTVNNHRDRGARLGSSRLKRVNSHGDPGGSWSRNAELSSLLDSSRVFASQKSQQSRRSGGVVVAKRRTVVTFGLASGERKGGRREEKRCMRGEKRGEKREERRQERGEKRWEREERREEMGERREERGEKRRERRDERREEREERREDRGGERERGEEREVRR